MVTKGLGVVVILLGLVSSMCFFDAGYKFRRSGIDLTQLRSKGGESVAEAYYQEIGRFGIGYGSGADGCGYAILMISVGLGGSMISKK
jgi:hypothetical protein